MWDCAGFGTCSPLMQRTAQLPWNRKIFIILHFDLVRDYSIVINNMLRHPRGSRVHAYCDWPKRSRAQKVSHSHLPGLISPTEQFFAKTPPQLSFLFGRAPKCQPGNFLLAQVQLDPAYRLVHAEDCWSENLPLNNNNNNNNYKPLLYSILSNCGTVLL